MKATIIGMLVCVMAAAVVMVAVALPRLRQGARVLTPAGRDQVTDARRRAMAMAAQAKERAALVAEQAKERVAGEQTDEPGDVSRIELDEPSHASVTASPAADQGGARAAAGPASSQVATAGAPAPAPPAAAPAPPPQPGPEPRPEPRPEPVLAPAARAAAGSQDVVDVRAAEAGIDAGRTRTLPVAAVPGPTFGERGRPIAGVIPGVSPRAPHRMSSWNPTSTGPRHAR